VKKENNMDLVNFGIISTETEEKIIQKGRKLLEENPFFKDLDDVMSQPEFRTFYNKYFHDISDMKTVLMYMKLYEELQREYRDQTCNEYVEKEMLAYMMKEFITNKTSRHMIVHKFSDFFNGQRESSNREITTVCEQSEMIGATVPLLCENCKKEIVFLS